MVKAVFTTKELSDYDDKPWEFYHFPKTYLNYVKQTVGDLVVYYEPRRTSSKLSSRGGKQAYFAVCFVKGIIPDEKNRDHFYAIVENYLRFEQPVSFRDKSFYYESALKRGDGKTNKGAFGRAVRLIPDAEFDVILQHGFHKSFSVEPTQSTGQTGLHEDQLVFDRPIYSHVVNRPFRDRAFTIQVQDAYRNRCAVTGLKITNGGGRPEIEAAHIRPVASHGPDMIQNGIALSRTAHWMFDRGLITFTDDHQILKSEKYPMDDAARLINSESKLILPDDPSLYPHPSFLSYHREKVFET